MEGLKLDAAIQSSGLKIDYIVDKLGISRQAFHKKRKGLIRFNEKEKDILCQILNVDSNIFLPYE
jgi:ACT domain-containing protein